MPIRLKHDTVIIKEDSTIIKTTLQNKKIDKALIYVDFCYQK